MQIVKISVKPKVDRLDQFLAATTKDLSRSQAKKLIIEGFILVNEQQVEASYKIKKGDKIEIERPVSKEVSLKAAEIPLKIIYEDKEILVIDKPAGLVVHPTLDHPETTVVNAVLNHLQKIKEDSLRPGIVHRLDKNTSGVLIIGKTEPSVDFLKKEFKEHSVKKTYLALVSGSIEKERGFIEAKIERHPKFRSKFITSGWGREALSEYKVIKRFGNKFTLVEVYPQTGRTHQIRVHLQSLGHPIVGDKLYGGKMFLKRQFLHAKKLTVFHPKTKKEMTFEAELPKDLKDFLTKLEEEKL